MNSKVPVHIGYWRGEQAEERHRAECGITRSWTARASIWHGFMLDETVPSCIAASSRLFHR